MQDEMVQEARDYAFNLLSYRERSKAEIRERLSRKGYSDPVISRVIRRLSELDFLNDRRFAEMWVSYRIKNKPRGRYLIIKELQNKGIEEKIILDVLAELLNREVELKLGKKLAGKWLNSHTRSEDIRLKLMNYLNRKGFALELIREIVSSQAISSRF